MQCINNCLNCEHFCVWDGDPVCIEEFKIILPSEVCEAFKKCTLLQLAYHAQQWEYYKEQVFKNYNIISPLKESYLKAFPEDENLINK